MVANTYPHVHGIFDPATWTVTYVVYAKEGGGCAIIDPVLDYDPKSGRTRTDTADTLIKFVEEKKLKVEWILETHAHADHITAAAYLKQKLGGKTAIGDHIPAVQKGILEALPAGVLAGFPVVDVKVTLFDGSYHEVDSNENAFKMAGLMAFKEGLRRANPALLEPIMAVEVETPEDFTGNVMGDLSSRRGVIQGMDDIPGGGGKSLKAEVPLKEMFGYSTTLRSLSQGRATYTMEFKHYSEAPRNIADEIINKQSGKDEKK